MDNPLHDFFSGILVEVRLAETLHQERFDEQVKQFDEERKADRAKEIAHLNESVKEEKAEYAAEKKTAKKKGADSSWPDPLENYRGPKHRLFYDTDLNEFTKTFETLCVDEQHKARTGAMVKGLLKSGQFRKLATIPRQYRRDIESLRDTYPNFSEVLDYIGSCCEIAHRTDGVLRMTPILLTSAPGVGKTTFVSALGNWLQSGFQLVRFDSAQTEIGRAHV